MDAKVGIFSLLSIRPHTITEIKEKMNYSTDSIYHSIHQLSAMGLIEKSKQGRTSLLFISRGHYPRKLGELFLKALSCDMDPGPLLDEGVLIVIKEMNNRRTLDSLCRSTGLGYFRIRRALGILEQMGVIHRIFKKPLTVEMNRDHPILDTYLDIIEMKGIDGNANGSDRTVSHKGRSEDQKKMERLILNEKVGISFVQ
ncbi:MAG: helix-turn-helix domain-containing protein [Candidatus Thermoplasmatota archaeon]|nr:helix-turn-helix domain-containing protein [Candidatus Thermoplasmatota archaeon]